MKKPLIELKGVKKCYGQGENMTLALNGVDLTIGEGEFVAIMGPSGSGKSTLLHILGFLDRPTEGEYVFAGKNSGNYSDDELAKLRGEKIGFIFQSFNLLRRTDILNNVKLPLVYSDTPEGKWNDLALEAIEMVGLSHRLDHESSQLSGGEQQRVAIARALVNKPKVIFADEPTGNLDSKSGQAVMKILDKLNEEMGHTIILITHETNTAQYAERIIRLKDGQIESDRIVEKRFRDGDGPLK